ncbi:MAG: hypothetical protein QXS93_01875 [Candidatus Micrarchaeia archaeon]
MKKALTVAVVALAILGIVFADIGPSPQAPEISVSLLKGGVSYSGEAVVEFVCLDAGPADDSPVGERVIQLRCNKGSCTNEMWFYKLNPCYTPGKGKFRYKLEGWDEYKETGLFDFSKPGKYIIMLDAETGNYSKSWSSGSCQGIIAFLCAVGLLALVKYWLK